MDTSPPNETRHEPADTGDGRREAAPAWANYGAYSAEDRVERRLALRDVRRVALRMTRSIGEQTLGPEADPASTEPAGPESGGPQPVTPEAALVFMRCANAVRLIVALEEKLDAQAWERENRATKGPRPKAVKNDRKDLLRRIVAGSIENGAEARDVHGLMVELRDRMEDPAIEERLASKERMADVAHSLCEELGVKAHFRPWSDNELNYDIPIDRSFWSDLPKLPTGMVGMPGIPSAYEIQERAAGRPWPPKMGNDPP